MTIDDLIKIEPELGRLKRHIQQIGRKRGQPFCANGLWYFYFKPSLEKLVGFGAHKAYRHLYNLLPDCTHDGRMCNG